MAWYASVRRANYALASGPTSRSSPPTATISPAASRLEAAGGSIGLTSARTHSLGLHDVGRLGLHRLGFAHGSGAVTGRGGIGSIAPRRLHLLQPGLRGRDAVLGDTGRQMMRFRQDADTALDRGDHARHLGRQRAPGLFG